MKTIPREEAVKMIRDSSPNELQEVRRRARKRKGPRVLRDAWLAPLTLDRKIIGTMPNKDGLRASNKGFLEMSWQEYYELLVWTGKQKHKDKRGRIPADYDPIMNRLGIDPEKWCALVWDFKKYFGRSRGAGTPERMIEMAANDGRSFQPGQKRARECFV